MFQPLNGNPVPFKDWGFFDKVILVLLLGGAWAAVVIGYGWMIYEWLF